LSFLLELLQDGWVGRESFLGAAIADLLVIDIIRGDAFLLDEFLDLVRESVAVREWQDERLTMSRVFLALSLTKGRAMGGMREEAGPAFLPLPMRYGTDMLRTEACVDGNTDSIQVGTSSVICAGSFVV
jgi:hypothetical protein